MRENFFYTSADGRMTMACYESPEGWFDVEVEEFDGIDYVLEGEVNLISEDEESVARARDDIVKAPLV